MQGVIIAFRCATFGVYRNSDGFEIPPIVLIFGRKANVHRKIGQFLGAQGIRGARVIIGGIVEIGFFS